VKEVFNCRRVIVKNFNFKKNDTCLFKMHRHFFCDPNIPPSPGHVPQNQNFSKTKTFLWKNRLEFVPKISKTKRNSFEQKIVPMCQKNKSTLLLELYSSRYSVEINFSFYVWILFDFYC
jgi:hypothetical protein